MCLDAKRNTLIMNYAKKVLLPIPHATGRHDGRRELANSSSSIIIMINKVAAVASRGKFTG